MLKIGYLWIVVQISVISNFIVFQPYNLFTIFFSFVLLSTSTGSEYFRITIVGIILVTRETVGLVISYNSFKIPA